LELDRLLVLGVLSQTRSSTEDFTDLLVATAVDLVADEGLKKGAPGNAKGYDAIPVVNNYYRLPTFTARQN